MELWDPTFKLVGAHPVGDSVSKKTCHFVPSTSAHLVCSKFSTDRCFFLPPIVISMFVFV